MALFNNASGIPSVQADPAPKLGGNLNLNGFSISNGISGLELGGAFNYIFRIGATPAFYLNSTDASFQMTGSLLVPKGSTAQRTGAPNNGIIRYNTDTNKFEAYQNGAWANMLGTLQIVTSETAAPITSATPVLVGGMTVTPEAGTYLVNFSMAAAGDTIGSAGVVRIYAGGVFISHSQRASTFVSVGGFYTESTQAIATVNGAEAIEIQAYRTVAGTLTIYQRSMTLLKIG